MELFLVYQPTCKGPIQLLSPDMDLERLKLFVIQLERQGVVARTRKQGRPHRGPAHRNRLPWWERKPLLFSTAIPNCQPPDRRGFIVDQKFGPMQFRVNNFIALVG